MSKLLGVALLLILVGFLVPVVFGGAVLSGFGVGLYLILAVVGLVLAIA